MFKFFNPLVKIGINLTIDENGKKTVIGMPKKWVSLKESVYNNEQNYAILTGELNDIIVIDLDNKGDFPSKEWFETNFFPLEKGLKDTVVTQTVSGGYHVYFKYTNKLKNRNDYLGKSIDILCDKKCVYEGKGYNILSNTKKVRKLTNDEITLLTQRKSEKPQQTFEQITEIVKSNHNITDNKWLIDNPRVLKKINKHIPTDLAREWEVELKEKSLLCVPKGHTCIISSKQHSIDNHCSLFVNNDGSVIKNCFSCGSHYIERYAARALQREFKLVLELQKEEDNIYCRLKEDMLDIAYENELKRDPNGNVYKKIRPYAYTFYNEYKDFLNAFFGGDKEFERNPNNMDNLIKFLKDYDNPKFSFIKPDKRYLGFSNGILDTYTSEFTKLEDCDGSINTKKYIDVPFSGETDTPLFDSIFDYQLDEREDKEEIKRFVYFCLGRLFGIRDKFDFTLYLMGEAGCGKSLVIDVIKQFFRDIGAVSSTFEKTFGLAYLYKKDIIVCDDLPQEFSKIFPQTIFQSCISGGELSVAIKGGEAKTINWEVPLLFAGNYNPDYVDKGQISRRIVTLEFGKIVKRQDVDTGLFKKICETELDKIALKSIRTYNEFISDPKVNNKSVWSFCPQYFRDNQEKLKRNTNDLYKFLKEHSEYKEGNIVPIKTIREIFAQSANIRVNELDNGTFYQVDDRYVIKVFNICKKCGKEAGGCCKDYSSKQRKSQRCVKNISIE